MSICIGIWFLLQEKNQTLSNLLTSSDVEVSRFLILSCFGVIIISSSWWVVNWTSFSLDWEITGWHEGEICCWRLKVWEPGGVVALISLALIARLFVVTRCLQESWVHCRTYNLVFFVLVPWGSPLSLSLLFLSMQNFIIHD